VAAKKANTRHVTALSPRFAPAADRDVANATPIALCVASADCREARRGRRDRTPVNPSRRSVGQTKIAKDDDAFTGPVATTYPGPMGLCACKIIAISLNPCSSSHNASMVAA
jgi:hypothetical protein